jgi:hypothetical protein
MVKYLSFHNSSFALRSFFFNVNGKATVLHIPCFVRHHTFLYSLTVYLQVFLFTFCDHKNLANISRNSNKFCSNSVKNNLGAKIHHLEAQKRGAAKGQKEFFLNRKSSLNSSYFLFKDPLNNSPLIHLFFYSKTLSTIRH